MTMPTLPPSGGTAWYAWAQKVHDAAVAIVEGRILGAARTDLPPDVVRSSELYAGAVVLDRTVTGLPAGDVQTAIEKLYTVASGASAATRLAEKYHNPTSGADYSNAGGLVYTKVDATNLVVAFTAPSSGRVRATVFGLGKVGTNGHSLRLALVDAADAVISGSVTGPTDSIVTQSNQFQRFSIPYLVDGLTSGTSYTWYLGWRMGGSAETGTLKQSGTGGPIGIEIEAW